MPSGDNNHMFPDLVHHVRFDHGGVLPTRVCNGRRYDKFPGLVKPGSNHIILIILVWPECCKYLIGFSTRQQIKIMIQLGVH
jgi:hypothetical protein